MDYGLIASVVTSLLVVAAAVIGVKYRQVKKKAEQLRDLVIYFIEAWEDDKLTPEEVEGLVERGKALIEPEEE